MEAEGFYVTGTTRYKQFPIDSDLPLNVPNKQIEKVNMIDFINASIADQVGSLREISGFRRCHYI